MDFFIFNDLSLPFADKFEVQKHIKHFADIFSKAEPYTPNVLRLPNHLGDNLLTLELAANYRLADWLFNPLDFTVEELVHIQNEGNNLSEAELKARQYDIDDLRTRIKSLITYSPLISETDEDAKNTNDYSDFTLTIGDGTHKAASLGAAYLLESIAISFLSSDFWDSHEFLVNQDYLTEDDIEQLEPVARHAATVLNFEQHIKWLNKQREDTLKQGEDVWQQRETILPNLILCPEVEGQLKKFGSSLDFTRALDRLQKLNQLVGDLKNNQLGDKNYADYGLTVSGESKLTMDNYGGKRKFRLPNGRREIFEDHIKIGGSLRIHFWIDVNNIFYIGYIGVHLKTWTG